LSILKYRPKSRPKFGLFFHLKNLPKAFKSRPVGEISPNLVTKFRHQPLFFKTIHSAIRWFGQKVALISWKIAQKSPKRFLRKMKTDF